MRSWKRLSAPVAGVVLITLLTLFAPARSVMMQSSLTFTQTKLLAADAAQYNYFGLSVAVRGDTAIVGAYGKSDLVRNAGAAYAFTRNAGSWTQQARLGTSSPLIDAYLGATVATNGSYTAAGAPYASVGAQNDGVVYLFSNATWQQQTILLPNDPDSLSQFGNALAINDNTLFVGAPMHDSFGVNAGAVYVFTFDGVSWVQQQKLIGVDTAPGDRFGSALALNDGWLAVSAPLHSSPGSPGGAVYLFEFDGISWVQRYKVGAPDTIAGDRFGSAIALDDGWLAVGVPLHRFVGSASGAVYLFEFNGTAWVQRQKFVASDTAGSDQFGSALALENRRLVVGAPLHNSNGPASGAVYIFERATTTWIERAKLIGSDTNAGDRLGGSISIDGNTILVGAYGDTAAGPATGAAYVFVEVTGPGLTTTPSIIVTPTETSTPSATPSNTPSPTFTSTPSATPTFTSTPSPTPSATPSNTPSPTFTSTPSPTPSATPTFTSTPSPTPSATPSNTPSATPSNTPTATATVPPGTGTPRPILACVARRSPASYVAIFGYEMEGTAPVHMPVGGENRFNRYREDLGQPTTFEPGTRRAAFAVVFDGLPLTWSLAGRQVTAWANYPIRCSSDAVVRIQPILECTLPDSNGTTIARFGYRNDNAFNVAVPVRWQNFFVPAPIQRGQPVVFAPGRHRFVFETGFSRGALVWFLDGRIAVATDAPVQACRFN
ncbi:MAG: alpha/beta hydrolase [Roseiflexus sp.]|uniref:alpha/beta hydrolase n=1 Tax=Roseiflexus sp. TaxID=2562120 RepID=UPI0025D1CE9B|nr:alpha/beta hydrolase [Roseiflexus sp.]MCL6542623.1 alpha/beta hydrolase [Roseiflexus sp.]